MAASRKPDELFTKIQAGGFDAAWTRLAVKAMEIEGEAAWHMVLSLPDDKAKQLLDGYIRSADNPSSVVLMGYAHCVEQEGMLPENQPLITHGHVSHTTANGRYSLVDYTSLPNCSGGAVVSADTGKLLGIHIHIGEAYHSAMQPVAQGNRKRKVHSPEVVKGRPSQLRQPMQRSAGADPPALSQVVDSLQSCMAKVEVESTSKGAVGYFVPCMRLRCVLEDTGVLQPSAEDEYLQRLSLAKLRVRVVDQAEQPPG